MRELLRRHWRFFLLASAAALLLRLLFVVFFPSLHEDSFIYGDIAKNWLEHGIYGLTGTGGVTPTYIRLPGYPAFLAFIFAIFGMEHYRAVLIAQTFVDLATCFICADLALRALGQRYFKAAFLLAALCPFLANYSAAALTETLEIFFTALALDYAFRALQNAALRDWAVCGLGCAGAILLRPDGVLLALSVEFYIGCKVAFSRNLKAGATPRRRTLQGAIVVAAIPLLALVPWTIRNYEVFHIFQPLVPRYANEEGEFVPMGFNHWVKTWMADYVSVEEVYWQVPGGRLDVNNLPERAFDNGRQVRETIDAFKDYNRVLTISPPLDKRFERIAEARIRLHPLRYYLWLPMLRIADMWLRPRTEILPPDTRWWEFDDELKWSALAIGLGVINLFYVLSAAVGWLGSRKIPWIGLLVLFVALRSAFLGTMENPEPRYTLEMFPAVIAFAAAALTRKAHGKKTLAEL